MPNVCTEYVCTLEYVCIHYVSNGTMSSVYSVLRTAEKNFFFYSFLAVVVFLYKGQCHNNTPSIFCSVPPVTKPWSSRKAAGISVITSHIE